MRRETKRSLQEVLKAIKGTGGIKTRIAEKLGCTRRTVDNYLDRWVTAQQAWEEEVERWGDKAEGNIYDSIEGGDIQDSKWYLSRIRKGKYSTRKEYTGADGETIKLEFVEVDDWRKHGTD